MTGITGVHKIGDQHVDKSIIFKTEVYVVNNASIQRVIVATASQSITVEEKEEIILSHRTGVSVRSGAELSFPDTGLSIELGGSIQALNW